MNLQKAFNKILQFFKFWYMRYLLSTELYIVEPWERAVIHTLLFIFLAIISYLNIILVNYLNYATSFII